MDQITKTKLYYPVTLEEAKRHLRVDESFEQDDDYIQGLIYAATQKAEEMIGKDIALTNNVVIKDDFLGEEFTIEEGNFYGLTSIVADNSTLVTPDKTRTYRNLVWFELPQFVDSDVLTIKFQTGFNVGQCPPVIKQAILVKIGDLYDMDRQSYTFSAYRDTKTFERLLDSYKIMIF